MVLEFLFLHYYPCPSFFLSFLPSPLFFCDTKEEAIEFSFFFFFLHESISNFSSGGFLCIAYFLTRRIEFFFSFFAGYAIFYLLCDGAALCTFFSTPLVFKWWCRCTLPTHTHTHTSVYLVLDYFSLSSEQKKRKIKESIIIETGLFFEAILY